MAHAYERAPEGYSLSTFPVSAIERAREKVGRPGYSELVLTSGCVILVKLSQEELQWKVFGHDIRTDGLELDLREMTGRAIFHMPANVGDMADDGTIYAGISAETDAPLCATPRVSSSSIDFNEAVAYARGLKDCAHEDWRLPTAKEVQGNLYLNRVTGAFAKAAQVNYLWTTKGIKGIYQDYDFASGRELDSAASSKSHVWCVRECI